MRGKNTTNNTKSRMTQAKVTFIERDTFTKESKKRASSRHKRRPWVETTSNWALEQQFPRFEILNMKTRRVKFYKNMIITSELIDRELIFLNLGNMK